MPNLQQLSDATLRAAVPPESGTVTLWDASVRQFGVRISAGGAKAFIILVGSGKRQTIGRYPTISLAQARTKAKSIFAERTLGRHQPQNIGWDTARDEFIESCKKRCRPRTWEEYARTLKSYFAFGTTRLGDVSKTDVARKLDKLSDTPSQQDHALVVAKLFFNWAIKRGYLDNNPTIASVRNKAVSRSRILTDAELKAVWTAAGQMDGQFGTIVKLLLLTGQRRGEVAALRSDYISNDTCTLPTHLTKNAREHSFPLGELSQSIVRSVLTPSDGQSSERVRLLFPARGAPIKPFNGWSKCKAALDKLSGVSGWTLHDLRRTFATRLAEMGIAPHVIERLLNHATGSLSPIALVYNRASFQKEMRDAIGLWEAYVAKIIVPSRAVA